ncbi:MAG: carbon-nitrogen hydrolase family protein [Bacillota bacterium]|nr:carbon-nitrogen hydrolase family protein [Bacillota bacterium]
MIIIKIGLIQLKPSKNKNENIIKAEKMIGEAALNGAEIISLPEIFNTHYSSEYFASNAETYPFGKTIKMLSMAAAQNKIYLIGGSIPEKYEDKLYNTCFIFDGCGNLIAKHRKLHLFDIDIKDKISFKESLYFSPGSSITVFDTKYCRVGVCICFDIRFPEIFRIMADRGAKLIFVPAAFNMTTGPKHWETLFKSRAMDYQVYTAGISPARDELSSYTAYGNSIICSPFGEVLSSLDEKEGILYGDIDMEYLENVRQELPLIKSRRLDLKAEK